MKRLSLFILAACFTLVTSFAVVSAHAAYSLSLDTKDGTGNSKTSFRPGDDLYLHIMANDLQGLAGCAFTLNYNSSMLVPPETDTNGLPTDPTAIISLLPFTFVKTGHADSGAITSRENSSMADKILFAGASIDTTTGGSKFTTSTPGISFPLFVVRFRVLSVATTGSYTFSLSQTNLNNTTAGYAASGENLPLLLGAAPNTDTTNWNNLSSGAFSVLLASLPGRVDKSFDVIPISQKPVVAASSGKGGLITPEGSQSVTRSSTTAFTLAAAPSYYIVGVSGSCGGTLNGNTYTTTAISVDCTVVASFAKADITFDEVSYLAANSDIAAAVKSGSLSSGWQHYAVYGWGIKEGRALAPSAYSAFDEAYYLQQSPDVAAAVRSGSLKSGWQHYALWGFREGRNARFISFDEDVYLTANPDVAAVVKSGSLSSGWQHYSTFGLLEGRAAMLTGYQNFSEEAYLAANLDVAAAIKSGGLKSGWEHYGTFGWGKNEARPLSPANYGSFNENAYLMANPDVAAAVKDGSLKSGWEHYQLYGKSEGRPATPQGYVIYSESAYLAANPDVAAAVKSGSLSSGWQHYGVYGWGKSENRSLSPAGYGLFNEYAYLAANPDVAAAVQSGSLSSGWQHYSTFGTQEGRPLNPTDYGSFNEGDYLAANPDVHRAVLNGGLLSGWSHYQQWGKSEGRPLNWGWPITN